MTAGTRSYPVRPAPATRFAMPPGSAATGPPEARGLARDQVRLMVASPGSIVHTRFRRLAEHLRPGDLIVVNTSATIAAAVAGTRQATGGSAVVVHFSGPSQSPPSSGSGRTAGQQPWVVELRDEALQRVGDGHAGEVIDLQHGVTLTLTRAWPDPTRRVGSRLWLAEVAVETGVDDFLQREGRPISYDHIEGGWPLQDYQTIFAAEPGSAEMASAARPFSPRVVDDLHRAGIAIAAVTLHTGVSSLEADETPLPERYAVGGATARAVNATRERGGRIVAAGTTVTRALESGADNDGVVHESSGVTDLVIGPEHRARVVTGLITGWHQPEASHLLMLEAIGGPELVGRAYQAATDPANGRYLWHEFGDSCLLLPGLH
jgi:S-adenosylmethionine:tRNA ribosyltransferase-isomerase